MRSLYSADVMCSAGCKYCFAKWNDIYKGQPLLKTASFDAGYTILYPCCDGELFEQQGIIDDIKNVSKTADKIFVSVSTKRKLSVEEFEDILSLNQWLSENKKGFVKFSVSVSTKSRLDEIEPGTMSYEERLLLAEKLKGAGVCSSLTLKPILPFVSTAEYIEIIRDFCPYIEHITVGGLYVNPASEFYREYIEDKYECTKRKVSWLNNEPEWYYIEYSEKIDKIREYALQKNIQVHDSDEELIKSIINRMG